MFPTADKFVSGLLAFMGAVNVFNVIYVIVMILLKQKLEQVGS